MRDLAGKTAFITGAASGIGLGVATRLAQAGVKVMMCDIEKQALDKAVADLRRANVDVDGVVADVSLKPQLQAAAEATLARYGEVHILHNNAGVAGGGPYGAWTDASWDWTVAVNLTAVMWGVEIFGPLIERHGKGGHIVNTASIAGIVSLGSNAYSITKYGVVALSEGLRLELARKRIGVSVLCPGFVRTKIAESSRNLQDRFAGALPEEPTWLAGARERVQAELDPLYVGELVREAIEEDLPYIFTGLELEQQIEARFDAIRQGFERIRGRKPEF